MRALYAINRKKDAVCIVIRALDINVRPITRPTTKVVIVYVATSRERTDTKCVPTVGRSINIGRSWASLRIRSSVNDFVNEYVLGRSPINLKITVDSSSFYKCRSRKRNENNRIHSLARHLLECLVVVGLDQLYDVFVVGKWLVEYFVDVSPVAVRKSSRYVGNYLLSINSSVTNTTRVYDVQAIG